MRFARPFALLSLLALSLAPTVRAAYPLPWPTDSVVGGPGRWNTYTALKVDIKDGGTTSTGGTGDNSIGANPTSAQDITSMSPDRSFPSAFWGFDATNEVFFYRVRVGDDPMATGVRHGGVATPQNAGSKPWSNGSWNLTMDTDGDGWKEFALLIDGNSGGGSRKTCHKADCSD